MRGWMRGMLLFILRSASTYMMTKGRNKADRGWNDFQPWQVQDTHDDKRKEQSWQRMIISSHLMLYFCSDMHKNATKKTQQNELIANHDVVYFQNSFIIWRNIGLLGNSIQLHFFTKIMPSRYYIYNGIIFIYVEDLIERLCLRLSVALGLFLLLLTLYHFSSPLLVSY